MSRMEEFFAHYRATFRRFERDPLSELFTFPLQLVSANADGVTVMSLSRDDWPAVLDGLFGAYRTLGVTDAEPLELDSLEVASGLATARVHWELRRDDGTPVYDFSAIYTVAEVDGSLRIAGIAHDELPHLAAALSPS